MMTIQSLILFLGLPVIAKYIAPAVTSASLIPFI